ncbi:unnamed protein product [Chrysodeixis includens]|uniref:Uncharacterized protein n=1 Tax=Chrysodeixis includens TaxID=689277 RepID=A0A9N8PZW0_CHRIL|nr:unnamed protein product [Chrysodeixis includens]
MVREVNTETIVARDVAGAGAATGAAAKPSGKLSTLDITPPGLHYPGHYRVKSMISTPHSRDISDVTRVSCELTHARRRFTFPRRHHSCSDHNISQRLLSIPASHRERGNTPPPPRAARPRDALHTLSSRVTSQANADIYQE